MLDSIRRSREASSPDNHASDSNNPNTTSEATPLDRELLPHEQEMLNTINEVQAYTEDNSRPKLKWGDANMDSIFRGIPPHIYLFAGRTNIGKSGLLLYLAWSIAQSNDGVYVLYHSLDDSAHLILPRLVALIEDISIEHAMFPAAIEEDYVTTERREEVRAKRAHGFDVLRRSVDRFKLVGADKGETVEAIEAYALAHKAVLDPLGKQLVLVIDNFHDLTTEAPFSDQQRQLQYIATVLNRLAETHLIPILASAELKKLNGSRRPNMDDVRETIKIQYKAGAIFLLHNDMVVKGEDITKIYWENGGRRRPVLEADLRKSKLSHKKGRLFWHFEDRTGRFYPAPEEAAQHYAEMVRRGE